MTKRISFGKTAMFAMLEKRTFFSACFFVLFSALDLHFRKSVVF